MTRTIELDCGHTFTHQPKPRQRARVAYFCKQCKGVRYAKAVKEGSIYVR